MSVVTVVVPIRGPTTYLGEALESLAGQNAEVLVVEDGTRVVRDSDVAGGTLLRLPWVGRSAARNAGVRAASTPFVAFLDADDAALPGRIERQLEALENVPDGALAFGRIEGINDDGSPFEALTELEAERYDRLLERGPTYASLLVDCPVYTSTTMVRREPFLAAGGYDPRHDAYEDLDLYLRLARRWPLVPTPGGPVSRYRRHPGNTTSPTLYAGALRVADAHLSEAAPDERRLLVERRLDCLWGLGAFEEWRSTAIAEVRRDPRLLAHRRLLKRLPALAAPTGALRTARAR